jgi:hypothetical protein
MIFRTRKFSGTSITLDGEVDLETDRIRFAAGETHIRRFDRLHHLKLRR